MNLIGDCESQCRKRREAAREKIERIERKRLYAGDIFERADRTLDGGTSGIQVIPLGRAIQDTGGF